MSESLEQQAETIIGKVLNLPTADRIAAATQECGGNHELLGRVVSLLTADPLMDGFMDATAVSPLTASISTAPVGEKPGDTIGRYKLLEKIGEGGFGVVFMAEQQQPVRRRVAVKVIKLGMDTREVVARFDAERQALAMMDHPNIARVLDAGATDAGRPYFVMELVRGSPVTDYADKHKLSTRERVSIAEQICRAVQHAHSKGVIHRDIKPNNVLVTFVDDKPVPKVIDFGIAKATQAKLTDMTLFTSHRQLIGTPQYMSPEQADSDGADVDTRTDVYSLGVLIYELLVGTTPLDARSLRAVAYDAMRKMIVEVDAPSPSTRLSSLGATVATIATNRNTVARQLERQLSGELDWIVMHALEKERARRYDTAAALADDLGRYLAGEAVSAGPVSGSYRLRKFARRYRATLGVAAVVAVALLLGVAGTTIGLVRETHQRTIADAERVVATQAQASAEKAAIIANRAAARSDARYLIGEGLLPAAYARAVDAWKLDGQWEDGFTLDRIRATAQQHWAMVAKIAVDANAGCIVRTDKGVVLAVAAGQDLTTYNPDTGQQLAHANLEGPASKLLANDDLQSVTVIRAHGVDRFKLDGLQRVVNVALDSAVVAVDASDKRLAVIDQSGAALVLSLTDLTEVAKLKFEPVPDGKTAMTRPNEVAISPSGGRILLKGGPWTEPYTLWELGTASVPAKISRQWLRADRLRFIKDEMVLGWFTRDNNGGVSIEAQIYALPTVGEEKLTSVFKGFVSGEDTKVELDMQAWRGGKNEQNIALIGTGGVATLSTESQRDTRTDRYANLIPTGDSPTFLTASFRSGLFVLKQSQGLAIFRDPPISRTTVHDFAAHGCRDGLLWVEARRNQPTLFLEPFDAAKPLRTFSLQWAQGIGANPDLMPWALTATPDGSTVVVITQGTDDFVNTVAATYGEAHALVYRNVGGWDAAPRQWKLDHDWNLHIAPAATWEPRHASVDPTGRILLYVTANGGAKRFSLIDGTMLGTLPLAAIAHLSDDGTLAAGIDPIEGSLNVFDIVTGRHVMTLPGQQQVTAVCISADDQRLLVGDASTVRNYSLPDGRLLCTMQSFLHPLAVPAGNPNRFVALQPDGPETTSGNLVVADWTGRVVTVLARTGTRFCPAQFSQDGRAVAVVTERWHAEVFRSLSPDQMAAAIEPPIAGGATALDQAASVASSAVQQSMSRMPLKMLEASDTDAMQANVGQAVAIHGRVANIGHDSSHSLAFLDITPINGGARTLSGMVTSRALAQFGDDDHLEYLKGREVVLSGSLMRRHSVNYPTLAVIIDDLSELQLLPAGR